MERTKAIENLAKFVNCCKASVDNDNDCVVCSKCKNYITNDELIESIETILSFEAIKENE